MTLNVLLQISRNTLMIPMLPKLSKRGAVVSSKAMLNLFMSRENKLQLNTEKCKEMIIDFKKRKHVFDPITVEGNEFDIVNHAKILGVTVFNNLLWTTI